MQLTNHKKDNYRIVKGTICRGTITLSQEEYITVYKYLTKAYRQAKKNINTYKRDSLSNLYSQRQQFKDIPFVLGVCATQMVAKNYKLDSYKNHNYRFIIN